MNREKPDDDIVSLWKYKPNLIKEVEKVITIINFIIK